MPQDVLTLQAIVDELADLLVGGRIDRITQPEKDEVFLHIRAKGQNRLLVISVNPNAPRMHLSSVKKDNPYAAPAFLMHLRKHLSGGIIQEIAVQNCDRIVCMSVLGRNELYDSVSTRLYIELMGRYSNLIAVDADGYITDALRHIPPDENQLRAILPHLPYTLPPMSKIWPNDTERVKAYLADYKQGDLAKYVFGGIAGMVNVSAREILARCGLDETREPLSPDQIEGLASEIDAAFHVYASTNYHPCYGRNGDQAQDYYVFPYPSTGLEMVPTDTINEAADYCASAKDRALRLKENGKPVQIAIHNAIKKNEKALAIVRQKLVDCEGCDKLQLYGELITCNLYNLQKGMRQAALANYYTGGEEIVPLDENKTPVENAQAYYKKYTKQKRTIAVASQQVEEYTQILTYLQSVECAFNLCESLADLAEIREELQVAGYMRAPQTKGKVRKPAALPPLAYETPTAYIWCGKNNGQNENLTFHFAKENDIWLHVKAAHGSHVICRAKAGAVDNASLQIAGEIAAYYSDQTQGDKIAVDYTLRRYVKHHPAKQVGMVIYTDYKTLYVTPNKHHEYQIEKE